MKFISREEGPEPVGMSGVLRSVLNGAFSALRSIDRRVRGPGLVELSVLSLAVASAFMVRVLPGRWGPILSEFDPWWHYTVAKMIIDRGWSGFFEFRNLVDTMSWHPTGLNVGSTFYPGVAFAMAFIYLLLSSLGISVSPLELAAILPVFYGMVTVVVIYLFARYALGRGPALAAALLLAVSNAHISRTHYGWFDDEALSIPLMHAGFLLYLVAINEKRSLKGAAVYGLLAGLALGGVVATWGAHRLAIALIPVFTALLVFLGRFRPNLLVAYLLTFATYAAVAVNVPKLGPRYLMELSLAIGWLTIPYLALGWYAYKRLDEVKRLLVLRGVVIAGAFLLLVLTFLGSLNLPGLKFFSVLVPTLRGALPIVQSVAENQLATWGSLFLDFGPTLPFALLGIYLLVKRGTDEAVFLMLYAAAALYAAGSMVRLALPTSPLVVVLAGLGLSHVLESSFRSAFAAHLRRPSVQRRAFVAVPLAVLLALSLYYLPSGAGNPLQVSGIDAANVPPTVLTSSVPTRQPLLDWVKAAEWMKYNLPPTAVVASWWDYGNWISRLGERKSIIDNTTIDSKRIALIGYAFMSPPNVSKAIFKELGATHVLIFVTFAPFVGGTTGGQLLFFGDESKWYWMLKIANQEAKNLGLEPIDENSLLGPGGSPVNAQQKFWDETTLGLMIPYKPVRSGTQTYYVYRPSEIPGFRLVYASSPPYSINTYAYVYIYEIVD
jgi:dolichyl-diphosphooligosaccharide--protein glycosyltransferase